VLQTLILYFLKPSKLKLSLSCAMAEFLFSRAVCIALLVAPLNHAWDLILDLKMTLSLVLISRRDLLDGRSEGGL